MVQGSLVRSAISMMNFVREDRRRGAIALLVLAIVGLLYVKWLPYSHKGLLAAANHSIGASILMGKADAPPTPSWNAAVDYALAYGKAIWQAMLLGLLLGSGVQAMLPQRWIRRLLGRAGFGSILSGGLLALPAMMCTCCAAPVVKGLRQSQASPGAAIAFWLGNSVLNPATLIFIGFVLGWHWTALRLGLGLLMVFGLGVLANRMSGVADQSLNTNDTEPLEQDGVNPLRRWGEIFVRMTLRLIPEYCLLVLLLGFSRAYLFPHIGPEIGDQIGWIIAFSVAGLLFVIPTAGEVPILQAMLELGMGVGPAAALLMTLPPVSLPSMVMLIRSFRPSILVMLAFAIALCGITAGLLAVLMQF
jgi:uncharacterized membrane protein YraQ (UPF0718 family)